MLSLILACGVGTPEGRVSLSHHHAPTVQPITIYGMSEYRKTVLTSLAVPWRQHGTPMALTGPGGRHRLSQACSSGLQGLSLKIGTRPAAI